MSVSDYIKQLQSYEVYAFSIHEMLRNSNAPEATLRKELARLMQKREVFNLRQGFYLINPPRYQNLGKLPIQLYIDKLFSFLDKTYYVGLYSAAAYHGAGHQIIQQEYIVTVPPALRDIDKGKTKLRFFLTKHWPEQNLFDAKSDAGYYKVSSPTLTAADLIYHHQKIGGINRMLSNLEELAEVIEMTDVENLLQWYPYKSTVQRLGYLLEQFQVDESITNLMYDHLCKDNFYSILLSPKKGQKAGKTKNRWKVDVNITLENDLI